MLVPHLQIEYVFSPIICVLLTNNLGRSGGLLQPHADLNSSRYVCKMCYSELHYWNIFSLHMLRKSYKISSLISVLKFILSLILWEWFLKRIHFYFIRKPFRSTVSFVSCALLKWCVFIENCVYSKYIIYIILIIFYRYIIDYWLWIWNVRSMTTLQGHMWRLIARI